MTDAQFTETFAKYGFASDGTMIFVDIDEYEKASPEERDNPDFWLEQLANNKNVWTK